MLSLFVICLSALSDGAFSFFRLQLLKFSRHGLLCMCSYFHDWTKSFLTDHFSFEHTIKCYIHVNDQKSRKGLQHVFSYSKTVSTYMHWFNHNWHGVEGIIILRQKIPVSPQPKIRLTLDQFVKLQPCQVVIMHVNQG